MRQGLVLEPGCFAYLPASHFRIDFEKVDLFTNFFSWRDVK